MLWPPVSIISGSPSCRPVASRKACEKITAVAASSLNASKLLRRSTRRCLSSPATLRQNGWARRSFPSDLSRRFGPVPQMVAGPAARPLDRYLLGNGPGAGVVQEDLAQASRAERGQELIEALAAKAEGLSVGVIAQRDDAVFHMGEVRTPGLQRHKEIARIVGDI